MFQTLQDRSDGQLLSAGYLNALSDNVAHVFGMGKSANMPFMGYRNESVAAIGAADCGWMIRHRLQYLHYKVVVNEPLDHFRIKATGGGENIDLLINDSPGAEETFQGAIDVSALLTSGTMYGLWFEIDFEGSVYASITISRLWESDAESVEPTTAASSYVVPPEWEQNYLVSAADMNKYKTGLNRAYSLIGDEKFNIAARRNDTQDRGFWFVNRHRWLHYVGSGELSDPSGVNDAVSISGDATIQVYDLAAVSWLAEGTLYNAKDFVYALEDYDA